MVVIVHLTAMAAYLSCRKGIDSPELARMCFKQVIHKLSVQNNITTHNGTVFTTRFWDKVCSHLNINLPRLTAFHLQTDGETERENQTTAPYLGACSSYEPDNWVKLLLLAESAYIRSIYNSTLMTPFRVNYNYHHAMQFQPPKDPSFGSHVQVDSLTAGVAETHRIPQNNRIESQE
jgi:hypothetical protein